MNRLRSPVLQVLLALALLLAGCASKPRLVYHSFGFDMLADSPDAELLDYRYGTSMQPGARPSEWSLKQGKIRQYAGTTGEMVLGDSLYAKWRNKSTGEVLEDTVPLSGRLPGDITNHQVYFVIEGRQLHVYLISPDFRPRDFPVIGPKKYRDFKVYAIYPAPVSPK